MLWLIAKHQPLQTLDQYAEKVTARAHPINSEPLPFAPLRFPSKHRTKPCNCRPHQVTSLVHDPPYLISAPVVGTNNSMSFLRFVLHALQVVASAPQILAFALLRVLTRTFKFVRTVWVSRRGRHSGPRQRQDSLLEAHPRGADRHAAGERGVPREAPQVLVVLASAAALKLVTL